MNHEQIDLARIQKAAHFMAKLWSDSPSNDDHRCCQAWRKADPANEQAWQQLLAAQSRFDQVPNQATNIITRSERYKRRQFLTWVALGAGSVFLFRDQIAIDNLLPSRHPTFATGTGETQFLRLSEKAELTLNTNTKVDKLAAGTIEVHREGECFLKVAPSESYQAVTPHGAVVFRQGELHIRCTDNLTRVSLYSGQSAQIGNVNHQSNTLYPGQTMVFNNQMTSSPTSANRDTLGWLNGKLIAQDMALDSFLHELNRYREGFLRVSPTLRKLKVSGVFSLHSPNQVLEQLEATFPIQVRYFTPYLANISLA